MSNKLSAATEGGGGGGGKVEEIICNGIDCELNGMV